ncbi:MAG: hypothetical protein U0350_01725 [Caldilineaceae bacterium]
MQPAIVMPMHDPDGLMLPHLPAIVPQLKAIFACAVVSVTPITRTRQPATIQHLMADNFFKVVDLPTARLVGEEFLLLYRHAATICQPDTILHLCFMDRVAFALQSHYREHFITDLQAVKPEQTPLIFQRSPAAWQTHPSNYYELEHIVTRTGELLLQQSLDFAWCHLALQAHQLQAVLPLIHRPDLSMMAELVLSLKDKIQTQAVDWLAWEDPFIYGRDAQQLKQEREQSIAETRKRLAYVIPMLQLLEETTR